MSAPRVVVAIHGIQTFGYWQDRLRNLLIGQQGILFEKYYYGFFSLVSFWLPFFRHLAVWRFRRRFLELVEQFPDSEFIIVAHSFGTYLAAFGLRGIPREKLPVVPCIILAGSVLKSNFDWSVLLRTGKIKKVVNDCGSGDFVLALSQFGVPFTGMAGCIGFFGFDGLVMNRVFPGGHSHYFESKGDDPAFMREHWRPILLGKAPLPGPERSVPNWLSSIYYTIVQLADPVKLLLYGGLLLAIVYYGYMQPRYQAFVAAFTRDFQTAASLLGAGINIPEATAVLTSLARKKGKDQTELPDPEGLLRYSLARLRPLSAVQAELPLTCPVSSDHV